MNIKGIILSGDTFAILYSDDSKEFFDANTPTKTRAECDIYTHKYINSETGETNICVMTILKNSKVDAQWWKTRGYLPIKEANG